MLFAFAHVRDCPLQQVIPEGAGPVIPEGAGPVKTTAAFAFACFGASWSWLGASK